MAFYVPDFFLDIETLADQRGLERDKLRYGLGLEKMAVPHPSEDAATMAAEAVHQLMAQNELDPRTLGRIYLGTESAWDGAKPMASYTLDMLEERWAARYGSHCLENCDVVDLTFACIGAVDALQNTLDWVAADPSRIGIVVASDYAKYEMESGGEYTQGAGAVALLIRQNPRLLQINSPWGVSTRSVHDFHKPKRPAPKARIIQEVLDLAEIRDLSAQTLVEKLFALNGEGGEILGGEAPALQIFRETPIFDGQYSNQCYQERILGAFQHFKRQLTTFQLDDWERIVLHLPYAKHGQRVFTQIYAHEAEHTAAGAALKQELGISSFSHEADFYRQVGKSATYRAFAKEKIVPSQRASAEIGNMYTASIFMALMSTLEALYMQHTEADGIKIGFLAYGSGSKAKVFQGQVQEKWQECVARFRITERLQARKLLDYATYHAFHHGRVVNKFSKPARGRFALQHVKEGKRRYRS